MSTPPPALQAPEGGPLDVVAIRDVLSGEFTVVTGPRRAVHRTRVDTFDRRLRAAGLALDHEVTPSGERLLLTGPDAASLLVAEPTGLRWPAQLAALPEGPVRDAVAPVVSIRALLAVTEQRRRVRRLELRNRDAKIVVRLEVDEPTAAAMHAAEVIVHPLRGYEEQARRVIGLLTGLGLRPVAEVDDEAAGPSATDDFDRGAPATALIASELGEFLAAMRANLPGLLDDVDSEFLHDFRVAVRRTRSTLKLGRAALPPVMRSRWEPAFKGLGDLTTPVRDLDVYQLDLPTMSGWLVAANADDLAPFAAHLSQRRAKERRALVRGLTSVRFLRLVSDWEQAVATLTDLSHDHPHMSAGELADRSISRAYRRVARGGVAISADSPGADLHELRKRCKELRYALEVFSPVIDKTARKRAVADLKGLQDVLGRFQDSEVQRHSLREFAEELMAGGARAEVILAMGELVGHLDADQDRARGDFAGAFARFVRPPSDRRLRRLGGGQ